MDGLFSHVSFVHIFHDVFCNYTVHVLFRIINVAAIRAFCTVDCSIEYILFLYTDRTLCSTVVIVITRSEAKDLNCVCFLPIVNFSLTSQLSTKTYEFKSFNKDPQIVSLCHQVLLCCVIAAGLFECISSHFNGVFVSKL